MSVMTKMAAAATKRDAKQHAKLTERHRDVLAAGEAITSTLSAVAPLTPQPSAWFNGALFGMMGYFIGRAVDRPKAQARARSINNYLRGPFSLFPESKTGYLIATTELRVLVFDGKGKELLCEGPISAMSISSIDHGSDMSSVIFTDGTEHVAVTTPRGNTRTVEVFVGNFPRVLNAPTPVMQAPASASPTNVVEF